MRPSRGALAALLMAASGAVAPAGAIVGPSTDGGALEASVLMVLNRQGRVAGFCSGIVVRQDAVLTAAHCAPPGAVIKLHYREGTTIRLLDTVAVERSPQFRADAIATRRRSIDLALIRLAAPLPGSFRPVALGTTAGAVVGAGYRLAGFGVRREGEADSSGTLRIADAVAEAPLSSILLWSRDPQGQGAGACTGDSGGPVVAADNSVVGVIAWSAGVGHTRCGTLTQAVWIAPQRAWIDATLARWSPGR